MISGHISEKRGYLYVILNLRKPDGTRGPKWFSTGLKAKGNKRKAEEILIEMRRQYSSLEISGVDAFRLSVSEYLLGWVFGTKSQIAPSTYESYCQIISGKLVPYFSDLNLMLCALKPFHLDTLYQSLLDKGLSPNTVIRYHAVIHKALNDAVRKEILVTNPAALAQRPSKEDFMTIPYSADEIQQLFDSIQGHKLELLIKLTAFYGLRRSEVLGLKWSDIDFNNDIFVVRQQIIRTMGHLRIQTVKTDASRRQLPLVPTVKKALLDHATKNKVELSRFAPQRELTSEGLVITTSIGTPMEANGFRRRHFNRLVAKHGLPRIKLHGLRHTTATLLKDMGVPVKDVQEILGHTDISTTLKIYQHGSEHIKRNALASMGIGLTAGVRSSCSQIVQSNREIALKNKESHLLNLHISSSGAWAYETHPEYSPVFATPVSDSNKCA